MTSRRSSLSKARGLGAAGSGTDIWFTQRVTWLATIILSFLVLALVLSQVGKPYGQILDALSGFGPTVLLTLFVAVASYHYTLELIEVIEDYVHHRALELALLIGVRFAFALIALGAILMIIRNFLGS